MCSIRRERPVFHHARSFQISSTTTPKAHQMAHSAARHRTVSHTIRSEGVGLEYLGPTKPQWNTITPYLVFLTRCLDQFHTNIPDEVRTSVDAELDLGKEWQQLKLRRTMNTITDRIDSQVMFGMTVSRDERLSNLAQPYCQRLQ